MRDIEKKRKSARDWYRRKHGIVVCGLYGAELLVKDSEIATSGEPLLSRNALRIPEEQWEWEYNHPPNDEDYSW